MRSGASPLHLFFCLPIAAVSILTGLPSPAANEYQPLLYPGLFLGSSVLAAACVFLLVAVLSKRSSRLLDCPLFLPCVSMLFIGEAVYLARIYLFPDAVELIFISAVLVGIGGALMMLLWACAFSKLPENMFFFNMACSMVLGATVTGVYESISWHLEATVAGVLMVIVAAMPLERILSSEKIQKPCGIRSSSSLSEGSRDSLLKPLFAFVLCWMASACSWGTALRDSDFGGVESNSIALLCGVALAGISVVLLSMRHRDNALDYSSANRKAPFFAVGLLVLSWLLSLMNNALFQLAIGVMLGMGQGLSGVSAFASLSHWVDCGRKPLYAFSVAGFLVSVSVITLAGISFILANAAQFITPVLSVVFLMMANIEPRAKAGLHMKSTDLEAMCREEAAGTPGSFPSIRLESDDSAISLAAEIYGLSPREREVLPYLAHGYTTKYIAENLYISLNTVKTHASRIYEKAGVHTRDDLIASIEILRN